MTPSWHLKVHEAAQSSLRSAHQLFHCIARQKLGRSSHELSSVAYEVLNEFKTFLSLLDVSFELQRKRIRKGPLPASPEIDRDKLMDQRDFSGSDFRLNQDSQAHALHQWFYNTGVVLPMNSSVQLDGCIDHNAMISCASKQFLNYYSCSAVQESVDNSLALSSMRNHGSGGEMELNASPSGGCHCSKRRKLRAKRSIRVPAVSSKLGDIPSDEFSWRKYGQKPIKGSPHPRSYYKCSRTRGCPARKHVERCMVDSSVMIVTYEGDHDHPSALVTQEN